MTKEELNSSAAFPQDAWGKASDRRGAMHIDLALKFVKDHPVGTVLSAQQFDEWMHCHAMLILPNLDVPRNSDPWLAHVQRRHIMRGRLNKSGNHPRMTEYGGQPFIIIAKSGRFEVVAPHTAIGRAELPRKLKRIAETKLEQLGHLMQSADWAVLPLHERAIAETIYDDIGDFVDDTQTAADRITRKLAKLERRIQRGIDAGSIIPTNGGLKQLLSPESENESEELTELFDVEMAVE